MSGPNPVGSTMILTLLVVLSLSVSISPALAAGETTVTISPEEATAEAGDRVTFDIVVDNVDGGVGAWKLRLNLSDGTVADIVDVSLNGDPGLSTVDIAEDKDSVYLDAALADTEDTGSVTIATVTVELSVDGQTRIVPDLESLGDEQGSSYTVTDVSGAVLATGEVVATASPTVTPSSSPTSSPTESGTDNGVSTGIYGDDETETDAEDTESATPTMTDPTESPTAVTDQPTNSATTTTEAGESTTGTATERSAAQSPSEGNSDISAPGFTGLGALFAVTLSVALLIRRR
jgi:hypothetical protein